MDLDDDGAREQRRPPATPPVDPVMTVDTSGLLESSPLVTTPGMTGGIQVCSRRSNRSCSTPQVVTAAHRSAPLLFSDLDGVADVRESERHAVTWQAGGAA